MVVEMIFSFFFSFCRSFEGVCSRLQEALESLRGLIIEYSVPTKETLIELAFRAINSVRNPVVVF